MPLLSTRTDKFDPVMHGQRVSGTTNWEWTGIGDTDPLPVFVCDKTLFQNSKIGWNIGHTMAHLYGQDAVPFPREENVNRILDRAGFNPIGEPEQQVVSHMSRAGYPIVLCSHGHMPQNRWIPSDRIYWGDYNPPKSLGLPTETTEPDPHLPTFRQWLEAYLEAWLGNNPKTGKPSSENRLILFPTKSEPDWPDIKRENLLRYLSDRLHAGVSVVFHGSGSEQERSSITAIERLAQVNPEWSERVKYLTGLESGWDGYGSDPIAEAAVDGCCVILEDVATVIHAGDVQHPFIAPLADGGLELEWDFPSGNELMIVVPPKGKPVRFLYSAFDDSDEETETSGTIPEDASLADLFGATTP